jgi:hypothetical protein
MCDERLVPLTRLRCSTRRAYRYVDIHARGALVNGGTSGTPIGIDLRLGAAKEAMTFAPTI